MGPRREEQAGRVGDDQDDATRRSRGARPRRRSRPAPRPAGQPSPWTSSKTPGITIAATARSSIVDWTLAAVRSNFCTLLRPPQAAHEHRRPHHQQDVPEDRADDRGLDHLVQPASEREQGDDQLRRVAEGDVEQAADAGARACGELLGRPAHHRRGRDHPERPRRRRRPSRRRASSSTMTAERDRRRPADRASRAAARQAPPCRGGRRVRAGATHRAPAACARRYWPSSLAHCLQRLAALRPGRGTAQVGLGGRALGGGRRPPAPAGSAPPAAAAPPRDAGAELAQPDPRAAR